MSNTSNAKVKIKSIDKEQWNLILALSAKSECDMSLEKKLITYLNTNLVQFPKAVDNFKIRITNILNSEIEHILLSIFKDIIDFQVTAAYIEPILDELKELGIISKKIPKVSFGNTLSDEITKVSQLNDFIKVFKSNNLSIKETITDTEKLHLNIIARYYDVLSTCELKDLLYDLTHMLNNKKRIKIGGNISNVIQGYKTFAQDTSSIFDSEKSKQIRINASLRIIGGATLIVIGSFCSIGTLIPIIGSAATVSCPILSFGGKVLSIFIDRIRDEEIKENRILPEAKGLLLFTLAKNSRIAWRSAIGDSALLLEDENGNSRTWFQFIIDIFSGEMTSHDLYNLCYVTMSSDRCINMTHDDLINNYDMLGADLDYIIKNIQSSEFASYISKKNYNVEKLMKELVFYIEKCDYNARCINEASKVLTEISTSLTFDNLINKIINVIEIKISNNVNGIKNFAISKEDLSSAIICLFNHIIKPQSNFFPLKDSTNKNSQLNVSYNKGFGFNIFKNLKKDCVKNELTLEEFKKDSSFQNRDKLEEYFEKTILADKSPSLNILIASTLEVLKNEFKPFKKYNSGRYMAWRDDYNSTIKSIENGDFYTNYADPNSNSYKLSLTKQEICGTDEIFNAKGALTKDCNRKIKEYKETYCKSNSNAEICRDHISNGNLKGGKINILGRNRNIITKDKCKYIRYKNELITIKEARLLSKVTRSSSKK